MEGPIPKIKSNPHNAFATPHVHFSDPERVELLQRQNLKCLLGYREIILLLRKRLSKSDWSAPIPRYHRALSDIPNGRVALQELCIQQRFRRHTR